MSRKEPEIVVRINQLKELLNFFIGIFMPIVGSLGIKDKFDTFTSLILELCEKALPVTSRNSSKSPASDPNRKRVKRNNPAKRKPGGQKGHTGNTLEQVDNNPDEVHELDVDKDQIKNGNWEHIGHEVRQVFSLEIKKLVIEYKAKIYRNADTGEKIVAPFPEGVNAPVVYSPEVKTLGTYLSQVLMVPYERSAAFFRDAIKLPVSAGSLCNFNASAADNLTGFMESAKEVLQQAQVLHVDETGINIDGKKEWCHCASSEDATILQPHDCRNEEAVLSLGVIHKFKGVLVHDFWAVYFAFTNCLHAVCNAHILRELLKASENYNQKWASFMLDFLLDLNLWVKACGGKLSDELQELVRMDYRRLIKQGEVECPETPKPQGLKSWRYEYAFRGKRNTLTLGKYPDLSLKEARKELVESKKLIREGIDPTGQKKNLNKPDKIPLRLWHWNGLNDIKSEYQRNMLIKYCAT